MTYDFRLTKILYNWEFVKWHFCFAANIIFKKHSNSFILSK